jgi:hypothetical protein
MKPYQKLLMKVRLSSLVILLRLAGKTLRNTPLLTLMCIVALAASSPCQEKSPKYENGTITSVVPHTEATNYTSATRYDVSIKVGNTVYVVLYTPPNGVDTVKYKTGMDVLVLVEKDTITFHDLLGRSTKVPILRRDSLPAQNIK